MTRKRLSAAKPSTDPYADMLSGVVHLLEDARRAAARTVNAIMTATYWEIGRRIVVFEQGGARRAAYGTMLLERLATDLCPRFGRGFSRQNLQRFRQFYLAFPRDDIRSTPSSELPADEIRPTASSTFTPPMLRDLAAAFPLSWSHYTLLVRRSRSREAMAFDHSEALRGGWSVRQLQRQVDSQFYERTALSRNKAQMLTRGAGRKRPDDAMSADEELKDPLVLEFLGLNPSLISRRRSSATSNISTSSSATVSAS